MGPGLWPRRPCCDRPDPWYGRKQAADRVGLVDLSQPDVDPINLPVKCIQLSNERVQSEARILWQVFSYLVQLRDKSIDAMSALRDNDAVLGQVRSERTSRHGALPNQKASCPMKHQKGLILA